MPRAFRWRDERGLSLIELAVVITVMAVLSAIAVPLVADSMRSSARDATAEELQVAAEQLRMDYASTGRYPSSLGAANSGRGLHFSSSQSDTVQYLRSTHAFCLEITTVGGETMRIRSAPQSSPELGDCA